MALVDLQFMNRQGQWVHIQCSAKERKYIILRGTILLRVKPSEVRLRFLWPDKMNLIILYLFYLYLVYYWSCKAALY